MRVLTRRRTGRRTEPTLAKRRMVGALAFLSVLVVVTLAYERPNPFADELTVRAYFADVSGVGVVGRDVRMAGTPVGRITGVERQGDRALVTMKLDRDAGHIGEDATAELRPHLAFEGSAYVELRPGSPSAPALGDRPIPLAHTRTYVPLDEALRVLTPDIRTALRRDVDELGHTLTGPGRSGLQRTLRGAPELTRTLAAGARAAQGPTGTELAGAIAGLSRTVDAIARRSDRLQPLLRDARTSFAALTADDGAPLSATLRELPGTLAALDAGGRALDGTIARLDPLARSLLPGMRALGPTLSATRPLLAEATPALRRAAPLLGDVRTALDAGAAATPATRAFLRALQPDLDLLDSSLLPALAKPTEELKIPAYLSFMNMFEGGGGASRPFQTAANGTPPATMGYGHYMRFGARFFTGMGFPAPPCTMLAQVNEQVAKAASDAGMCTP